MSSEKSTNTDLFYSRLPVNNISLSELLLEEHLFYRVPPGWHVLITDIKGSTEAIVRGQHENINLLATGSIVAVLNLAYRAEITIPFFFGGDGATFLIPDSLLGDALHVLLQHQENTKKNFELELRVGSIRVADIYAAGFTLTVTKLRASRVFAIPVALGTGIAYAEKVIKGDDYLLAKPANKIIDLDLSGMQCRWDKIPPPIKTGEVVSLLVLSRDDQQQAAIFKKVIDLLDGIYGQADARRPISVPGLKMNGSLRKLAVEMRTKFGGKNIFYLLRSWIVARIAAFYFKTKKGKSYLDELIEMTDTLVLDGKINTVISGTTTQRHSLEQALSELELRGEIYFGLYVSGASVMSCYVRSINEDHIHFVDGAEGGYTRAASELKAKFHKEQAI